MIFGELEYETFRLKNSILSGVFLKNTHLPIEISQKIV